MINRSEYMTVPQVADYMGCTVQNIYQAIWRGRLRAIKFNDQRLVKKEWVDKYIRYYKSKQESVMNGKKVFNAEKGEYSAKMASETFNIDIQHLYYLAREGRIPCTRKGSYVVFHHKDLVRYLERQNKRNQLQA